VPGYSAAPIPARDAALLKPEETASMMRVSRTKVYDLMRTGKLRSIKVDGLRRIPREAIAEYVDSQSG